METTMKKLVLATSAILLSAPAFAADLPRAAEPVAPAPYIAPAAFNWSGFYVGVNAGYAFGGDFDIDALDSADGFVGGAQAGYNFQFDPIVVGIEGEIAYADVSDKFADLEGTLNWRGSVTPRLGFAIDRFMPYLKGGLAFGDVEVKDATGKDDKTQLGWTVGAGAEYAVTDNVTVRAEYNYTDLGKDDFTTPAGTVKAGYKGSDVRAGVNYKF
jgi:outer membrane immunogenic protein